MGGIPHAIRELDGPPPEKVLADLAARQWGVVSAQQLRELGFGRSAVSRRVQAGRLHRMHRGVYAVGHRVLRIEGHRLAAVLACGPSAVLSHLSAAAHWGLLATDQTQIDVTAPRSRDGRAGIRLHRSRSLDARDKTMHEHVPVTTIARTLLDLAATLPTQRLERALAQADHLRVYDHRAITDVIARSNGHRGTPVLARAVAGESKWTRNDFEARFLQLIRDAGLLEPLVNHSLIAPDYGHCEPDFLWPKPKLVVEADSWSAHGTKAAFERDRAKDAALTASGYRVLRFTWRTRPETAVRRLRALLA